VFYTQPINCWRKAGIINFRFSLTKAETDEHTTLSSIDEIKEKVEFTNINDVNKQLRKI